MVTTTITIITNLLANMVVLTMQSTIPTNTPAFQRYAFNEMFHHATNMAISWNLDLSSPIATNAVTAFHAVADQGGASGDIVLSNRFYFQWWYGGLPSFNDQIYSCLRVCLKSHERRGIKPIGGVEFESWRYRSMLRRWFPRFRNHGPVAVGASTSQRFVPRPSGAAIF